MLVDARERRIAGDESARKTELLLAHAGLSHDDIAAVTGKTSDAVRKTVERNRAR